MTEALEYIREHWLILVVIAVAVVFFVYAFLAVLPGRKPGPMAVAREPWPPREHPGPEQAEMTGEEAATLQALGDDSEAR